jgi:hypothetical protein
MHERTERKHLSFISDTVMADGGYGRRWFAAGRMLSGALECGFEGRWARDFRHIVFSVSGVEVLK